MHEVLSPDSRVIQIDSDSRNLGKRIAVDVPLLSSMDEALTKLVNLVDAKGRRADYLDFARDYMAEMFDALAKKRMDNSTPINPYRLVSAIESTIDDDAIITTDAGAVELYFSSGFKFTNHKFVVHGRYASLGFGIPAAISAQLVYPNRQTVAVEGGLGFMTCLAELMTAMENSLPIKVIVFNNRGQAAIKFEQLAQGLEEFATQFSNDFNFAKFAEACGAYGRRVEDPAELNSSLEDILSARGPAVLDVITFSEQLPIF